MEKTGNIYKERIKECEKNVKCNYVVVFHESTEDLKLKILFLNSDEVCC